MTGGGTLVDVQATALDRFHTEFRRWVAAHNEEKGFATDADKLLSDLKSRIGDESLRQIGGAFIDGWLETERGYRIRETNLGDNRSGQVPIANQDKSQIGGKVAPCWELYVQLADYGRLRRVAETHGHTVRLEDDLMDIVVWAGSSLLLYVENKEKKADATKLVEAMRAHGLDGVSFEAPSKKDALKKARYLTRDNTTRTHPRYFGLSAVGYRKLFRVEYEDGHRFRLIEERRAFADILAAHPATSGEPPPRARVDPLANEIEQTCPEVWISVGSGDTAYNFYAPGSAGDAVIIGVYRTEEVWTDIKALGVERAKRFAAALGKHGIAVDAEKDWCFWKKDGALLKLTNVDRIAVAEAVRIAIDSTHI